MVGAVNAKKTGGEMNNVKEEFDLTRYEILRLSYGIYLILKIFLYNII